MTAARDSTRFQRMVVYILGASVVAGMMLTALLIYQSNESTETAQTKADQLIAALQQAGAVRVPSQEQIVGVLGDDGGATCSDPGSALARGALFSQLANGAAGPGARPVIADSKVVQGQLLILQIYCPDELAEFEQTVQDLKFEDVVKP
ncbi:hypothetical protein ACFFMN_35090 [Planobispora siamensis]|uniref:Uncharacterized protein n=1 Tax=Planobispora siamensis TaxID=936338 RepID=A0A8J3WP55_9ACTN|nr:hypothetical protein [Planobispora siamensis]GIH96560.1 hypothetical protein Psi01_71900 [Planobispora siamensis]